MSEENEVNPIATPLQSSTSSTPSGEDPGRSNWLKVGVVASASALAGGLAAAWYYRRTLARLRQTDSHTPHPDFRILDDPGGEDD